MTQHGSDKLEALAADYAKRAQFEFSPIQARFLNQQAARLMDEAQTLRTAELAALVAKDGK